MQKKIIALAVAGLVSGGALAQSSVKISGLLGATAVVNKFKGSGSTYAINNDGAKSNGLTFSGVEDLGGGLKATFVLSEGLDVLTGATGSSSSGATATGYNDFNRAANVGLAGAFGSVAVGRQTVPSFAAHGIANNFGFNSDGLVNFWANAAIVSGSANLLTGLNAPAPTNTSGGAKLPGAYVGGLGYSTPNFAGFKVNLFTTLGNNITGSSFNNNAMTDASLVYDNGTIGGVAAFNRTQNKVAANAVTGIFPANFAESKTRLFGLNYKTGPMKFTGGYVKQTYDPALAATNHDFSVWSVGASYAIGDMRYGIDYAVMKDSIVTANKAVGTNFYADYSFSKRTDVFAILAHVNNSGASIMTGMWKGPGLSRTGVLDARNGSNNTLGLGINHRF